MRRKAQRLFKDLVAYVTPWNVLPFAQISIYPTTTSSSIQDIKKMNGFWLDKQLIKRTMVHVFIFGGSFSIICFLLDLFLTWDGMFYSVFQDNAKVNVMLDLKHFVHSEN